MSALYPFRPSFYERFGYVGLPKARTVTFSPADLAGLLRRELPGEVRWERSGTGYRGYRDFTIRLLAECHGFAVLPDYRAAQCATPTTAGWLPRGTAARCWLR